MGRNIGTDCVDPASRLPKPALLRDNQVFVSPAGKSQEGLTLSANEPTGALWCAQEAVLPGGGDRERARDGRSVEVVGTYNPRTSPATVELKQERIQYWMAKDAKPSETVARLMKNKQAAAPAA
jgi:small subunit ribosomal protein S16